MRKNKNSAAKVCFAAATASVYVLLTALSGALGLAYGGIQLRLSEALTVLPVRFPCAIAGLTLGCLIANAASPLGPFDMLFGTVSTLISACLTALLRNVKIKNYPLLSFLSPVVINAAFVALETVVLSGTKGAGAFFTCFAGVFAGQALSVFVFGSAVCAAVERLMKSGSGIKNLTYETKVSRTGSDKKRDKNTVTEHRKEEGKT